MRFLLLPLGTYGDLKPFLEVGSRLQERGHEVLLASAEPFRQAAEERGLSFFSVLGATDHAKVLADPNLWDRRRYFQTFVKGFMLPAITPIIDLVRSLPEPGQWTLVSAYSGSPGARIAAEVSGARMVSMWLDPASVPSTLAPPVLSGAEFIPRLPYLLRRLAMRLVEANVDRYTSATINRIRKRLGLAPVHSILRWMASPHRSVCLFPDWYAAPQADWPAGSSTVGFPLTKGASVPVDVEEFLAAGEKPLVVTFGSAMKTTRREFGVTLKAIEALKLRAVLVCPSGAALPSPLPPDCAVFHHRPLMAGLLPRAAAIIHHGGIGTLAEALGAGIPQLAVHMGHDQPDNAARLERLGVGLGLAHSRFHVDSARTALGQLLTPARQERCRKLALRMREVDGVEGACLALEGDSKIFLRPPIYSLE